MLAGVYDPGAAEPRMRPLAGHSIAVYEPDARLSLCWPLPDEDEYERRQRNDSMPEWLEQDTHEWNSANRSWAVVLLSGSPVWQAPIWYLDWGSGIGGYVSNIEPVFGDRETDGRPEIERWHTTAWAVGLAALINSFAAPTDFYSFDPTRRLVPQLASIHPVDEARAS